MKRDKSYWVQVEKEILQWGIENGLGSREAKATARYWTLQAKREESINAS